MDDELFQRKRATEFEKGFIYTLQDVVRSEPKRMAKSNRGSIDTFIVGKSPSIFGTRMLELGMGTYGRVYQYGMDQVKIPKSRTIQNLAAVSTDGTPTTLSTTSSSISAGTPIIAASPSSTSAKKTTSRGSCVAVRPTTALQTYSPDTRPRSKTPVWAVKTNRTDKYNREEERPIVCSTFIRELAISRNIARDRHMLVPTVMVIEPTGLMHAAMPIAVSSIYGAVRPSRSDESEPIRISPRATLRCLEHISRALSYLSSEGISHLDISPSNIMMIPDHDIPPRTALESSGTRFVLADMGFAATNFIRQSGHPWCMYQGAYRAPELIAATSDTHDRYIGESIDGARTDVWALGCVMVWLIAARFDPSIFWFTEGQRLDDMASVGSRSLVDAQASLLAKIESFLGDRALCSDKVTRKMTTLIASMEFGWRIDSTSILNSKAMIIRLPKKPMEYLTHRVTKAMPDDIYVASVVAIATLKMLEMDPRNRPSAKCILNELEMAMACDSDRAHPDVENHTTLVQRILTISDTRMRSKVILKTSLLSAAMRSMIDVHLSTEYRAKNNTVRNRRAKDIDALRVIELANELITASSGSFMIDGYCKLVDCEVCSAQAALRAAVAIAISRSLLEHNRVLRHITAWLATDIFIDMEHNTKWRKFTKRCREDEIPNNAQGTHIYEWFHNRVVESIVSLITELDMEFDIPLISRIAECTISGGEATRQLSDPRASTGCTQALVCAIMGMAMSAIDISSNTKRSSLGIYCAEIATRGVVVSHRAYASASSTTTMTGPSPACTTPSPKTDAIEDHGRAFIESMIQSVDRSSIERVADEVIGFLMPFIEKRCDTDPLKYMKSLLGAVGWDTIENLYIALIPPWIIPQ